ncbi:Uncharacterised protein [Escherichia coli]|uniref:Uncharacterized protein n=1 Tax=Escherichia coli TaxID=562 RepID=A0A377DGV2_ECOLX|nr:Uncharacterised protein [Escherichia coli]
MAYLRQKLLERLRTIGVVNHHFNHRGGWRAPGVGKCRFKFLPVLRTMIFQLEHRGGRAQNGRFAASDRNAPRSLFGVGSSEKICPPLLFTTINTSGAET